MTTGHSASEATLQNMNKLNTLFTVSYHLPDAYTMLQVHISKHAETKLRKLYTLFQIDSSKHIEESTENSDGRTNERMDRQIDGHCHSIMQLFFKWAYRK